jgi:hypothetical protein
MLWGRREMFEVTRYAAWLGKDLLDWAGVHTGRSAAAETMAAVVAAAAAEAAAEAVVAAEVVAVGVAVVEAAAVAAAAWVDWESIAAWPRAAGNSWRRGRWRRRRRETRRQARLLRANGIAIMNAQDAA